MADERPGVGSVAEETARLLDALLAGTTPAPDPEHRHDPREHAGHEHEPAGGEAYASRADGDPPASEPPVYDTDVCRLCPVCQLLRVVRSVQPETLDRLADLAAAVTDTLRDAAASRWRETGATPARRARPEVEDIVVEDEEAR